MNPAFSSRHVQELYPVFWSKAGEMVSRIQDGIAKSKPDSVVDITTWVSRAALDIIGIAALGVDFASLADPDNELSRAYQVIFEPNATSRIIFLLAIFVSVTAVKVLPLQKAREIRAGSAYVKKYLQDMTSKRGIKSSSAALNEKSDEKDILSIAARYGGFTADELVDQARTFLVAGHETTATGVQWTLYTLTRPENLHIQQRLREEVHKDLPKLCQRNCWTNSRISTPFVKKPYASTDLPHFRGDWLFEIPRSMG